MGRAPSLDSPPKRRPLEIRTRFLEVLELDSNLFDGNLRLGATRRKQLSGNRNLQFERTLVWAEIDQVTHEEKGHVLW